MPIYTYRCPKCGTSEEAFRKVDDRNNSPHCCDEPMERGLDAPMVSVPQDFAYKCTMSGETVTTYRKRRYLMEKHGVVDARDYTDHWKKCAQKRAEEKAEAQKFYDSLPDAVKSAGTEIAQNPA